MSIHIKCDDCAHKYTGVDGVLYCRPDTAQWGMKCSPAAAEDCTKFEAVAADPVASWCGQRRVA